MPDNNKIDPGQGGVDIPLIVAAAFFVGPILLRHRPSPGLWLAVLFSSVVVFGLRCRKARFPEIKGAHVMALLAIVLVPSFLFSPRVFAVILPLAIVFAAHAFVRARGRWLDHGPGRLLAAVIGGTCIALTILLLDALAVAVICEIPMVSPDTGLLGLSLALVLTAQPFVAKVVRKDSGSVGAVLFSVLAAFLMVRMW